MPEKHLEKIRSNALSGEHIELSDSANTKLDSIGAINLLKTLDLTLTIYKQIINRVSATGDCCLKSIEDAIRIKKAHRDKAQVENDTAIKALIETGLIVLVAGKYYPSSNGIELVFAKEKRDYLKLDLKILNLAYTKDGMQLIPNFEGLFLRKVADQYREKKVQQVSLSQATALEPKIPSFFIRNAMSRGIENECLCVLESSANPVIQLLPLLFERYPALTLDMSAESLLTGGKRRLEEQDRIKVSAMTTKLLMDGMGADGIGRRVCWEDILKPIQELLPETKNLSFAVSALLRQSLKRHIDGDRSVYELQTLSTGSFKGYQYIRIDPPANTATTTTFYSNRKRMSSNLSFG